MRTKMSSYIGKILYSTTKKQNDNGKVRSAEQDSKVIVDNKPYINLSIYKLLSMEKVGKEGKG